MLCLAAVILLRLQRFNSQSLCLLLHHQGVVRYPQGFCPAAQVFPFLFCSASHPKNSQKHLVAKRTSFLLHTHHKVRRPFPHLLSKNDAPTSSLRLGQTRKCCISILGDDSCYGVLFLCWRNYLCVHPTAVTSIKASWWCKAVFHLYHIYLFLFHNVEAYGSNNA